MQRLLDTKTLKILLTNVLPLVQVSSTKCYTIASLMHQLKTITSLKCLNPLAKRILSIFKPKHIETLFIRLLPHLAARPAAVA